MKQFITGEEASTTFIAMDQGQVNDEDLVHVKTDINSAIEKANQAVTEYQQREDKKAKDAAAKKEAGDNGPIKEKRTDQDKSDFAAFLAGN